MHRRGRNLIRLWQTLVNEIADGNVELAEKMHPRLASFRKRALRIALKLRTLRA